MSDSHRDLERLTAINTTHLSAGPLYEGEVAWVANSGGSRF
jgi:hypothetical protein